MPPLASPSNHHAGFTSHLRGALLTHRSKLEEWVEREKGQADAVAEEFRRRLVDRQRRVDESVAHLLSLQLKDALTVSDTNSESAEKLSEITRESLEQKYSELQAKVESRRKEMEERNKRNEGAQTLWRSSKMA
eukprot:Pompholyxophrys_punicea_v1_NODE_68_length_3883_cov_3.555643.p2 type:complete len:134 gc:universal NODE_68_length_3883_cov_3.555643:980-1381(+)